MRSKVNTERKKQNVHHSVKLVVRSRKKSQFYCEEHFIRSKRTAGKHEKISVFYNIPKYVLGPNNRKKYLEHQQDLYHVFIDFKKAFDRV